MIFLISVLICFFTCHAAIIPKDYEAYIIKYENTNDGNGTYKFSFETSNGISREENGFLVNIGEEDEYMYVRGSYSYTDSNGNIVTVKYTADENGYHIINSPLPQTSFRIVSTPVVATLLGK